jgi:hypothetical protein
MAQKLVVKMVDYLVVKMAVRKAVYLVEKRVVQMAD